MNDLIDLLSKLNINLQLTGVQAAVMASSVGIMSGLKKALGTFWDKTIPSKVKPWILLGLSAGLTVLGLQANNDLTVGSATVVSVMTWLSAMGVHTLQKTQRKGSDDPRRH